MRSLPAYPRIVVLCVVMVAGMIVVGLWPFGFRPANRVHWLQDRAGLQFQSRGMVYDPEPLPTVSQQPTTAKTPASVTVELWAQANEKATRGLSHVLTIHDRRLPSNLALCQWRTEMLLRVPAKTRRGFREIGVRGALELQHRRLITLTCDPEGASWFLDGTFVRTSPGFTLPSDSLRGRLILGDAADGKSTWNGRLYGVAILNRALTADEVKARFQAWTNRDLTQLTADPGLLTLLPFKESQGIRTRDLSRFGHTLEIPKIYRPLCRTVLEWPSRAEPLNVRDVWINVLGFMPLGFVVYWYLRLTTNHHRLQSAAVVVAVGIVLSLFIELTQVWLPNRDSSSLDLMCNTLGTLLGVCLAILVRTGPIRHQKRRRPTARQQEKGVV